ncbi:hypothetical protein DSO57_1038707 [Entomophthora muscae]|uniref:Uncharacterized protein n=1 Tax=Entomophthora muscae TaxID=34485 RepID=A0ACC2SYV3_9FUNG|nr:hypothetical protein DSO57_1038707 [Entomophthora muscae]
MSQARVMNPLTLTLVATITSLSLECFFYTAPNIHRTRFACKDGGLSMECGRCSGFSSVAACESAGRTHCSA